MKEPNSYNSIHEMLKLWATTPDLTVQEDTIVDGVVVSVHRRLTPGERLRASSYGGDYFAPKLKAIETKSANDFSSATKEELEARIKALLDE